MRNLEHNKHEKNWKFHVDLAIVDRSKTNKNDFGFDSNEQQNCEE